MKRTVFFACALLLAGCASMGLPDTVGLSSEEITLSDHGLAPELAGDVWLNTPTPLRMADLRGKVVLVEMWTFDCINCQHVIPSVRGWHDKYASQGLVVIGNHYPEFDFEGDLSNLKQAVVDLDVPYAVVQDNDGTNWQAYKSYAWPSLYLIDKLGHIRYIHIGEGRYTETEAAIQALLDEPGQQS